jgi:hypothetical protein
MAKWKTGYHVIRVLLMKGASIIMATTGSRGANQLGWKGSLKAIEEFYSNTVKTPNHLSVG